MIPLPATFSKRAFVCVLLFACLLLAAAGFWWHGRGRRLPDAKQLARDFPLLAVDPVAKPTFIAGDDHDGLLGRALFVGDDTEPLGWLLVDTRGRVAGLELCLASPGDRADTQAMRNRAAADLAEYVVGSLEAPQLGAQDVYWSDAVGPDYVVRAGRDLTRGGWLLRHDVVSVVLGRDPNVMGYFHTLYIFPAD